MERLKKIAFAVLSGTILCLIFSPSISMQSARAYNIIDFVIDCFINGCSHFPIVASSTTANSTSTASNLTALLGVSFKYNATTLAQLQKHEDAIKAFVISYFNKAIGDLAKGHAQFGTTCPTTMGTHFCIGIVAWPLNKP